MTTLTSPVGKIVYMGLDKPRSNYSNTREEYSIRLLFDGTTAEGAAFKKAIQEVNKNKVVTKSEKVEIPNGYYMVSAWSKYKPQVKDSNGDNVEEVPYFGKGSTGEAVMTVKPFEGAKGDGLNLTGVVIVDLNLTAPEKKESETQQSLLEAVAKLKKG